MTLQKRILSLIALALLLSIAVGSVLTYWHANKKVAIEMEAALAVADGAVRDAVEPLAKYTEPSRQLQRIVASFNGNRHLRAFWIGPTGATFAESNLLAPSEPVPEWFYVVFAGEPHTARVPLPERMSDLGHILLSTDSHSEVSEVWEDLSLKALIVAAFSALVLTLVFSALKHALSPLGDLTSAFSRVGRGDYDAQVSTSGPLELSSIYKAFNGMARQLADMEQQNARLNDQVVTVQEEERADIARDLHDEFGPFLFSIDVDARSIRRTYDRGQVDGIGEGADSIRLSIAHLQTHLRSILGKLRPTALLDLGLSHALEHLVHFWKGRQPEVRFTLNISANSYGESADNIAYRVVQEGLNNAVRHGKPADVGVNLSVKDGRTLIISVTDDGHSGNSPRSHGIKGFGLTGMRERLSAAGGSLCFGERQGSRGFEVIAELPLNPAEIVNAVESMVGSEVLLDEVRDEHLAG